jgi:hypothetical protein
MPRRFDLLFALTAMAVLLGIGSIMNSACKTSHHPWCIRDSQFRHPITISHSLAMQWFQRPHI